ncbi:RING finger protein 225-like [Pristis pectinata]|uniref:RING finger protein 225-like n=1 Tax=Pristis pectinata TaxID=685728 RepID=UPI00223DA375|nr:RING finger protein 225-like [Pristis pectinata]
MESCTADCSGPPAASDGPSLTAPSTSASGPADLECAICFSPFDNVFKLPKLLACGHTFCLECLARINVSSENSSSVACPFCRQPTPLPSGKGLPALDNNQDVLSRLPSSMQTVPSIRFSRDKGKLYTKGPEPGSFLKPINSISMSLDVGQPMLRGRASSHGMPFRTSWCYYVAIVCVVLLTIALVFSGIFIFVIVPSLTSSGTPGPRNTTGVLPSSSVP